MKSIIEYKETGNQLPWPAAAVFRRAGHHMETFGRWCRVSEALLSFSVQGVLIV